MYFILKVKLSYYFNVSGIGTGTITGTPGILPADSIQENNANKPLFIFELFYFTFNCYLSYSRVLYIFLIFVNVVIRVDFLQKKDKKELSCFLSFWF